MRHVPKHLKPATKRWWKDVESNYQLEEHHRKLLTMAGECWDRSEAARAVIDAEGPTVIDRFDQPRARPEVDIELRAKTLFARLLRELALDVEAPGEVRMPGIGPGRYRRSG